MFERGEIQSESCIVCAIWPLLYFIPYHCINYNCPHRSKSARETVFNLSWLRALFTNVILFCGIKKFNDIILILISCKNEIDTSFYVHELSILIAYMIIIFDCFISSEKKLDSLNGHQSLIEFIENSFLKLDRTDLNDLRTKSFICISICLIQVTIYSYFLFNFSDGILSNLVTFFGKVLITYSILLHSYVFYIESYLQKCLQEKLFAEIKYCLNERNNRYFLAKHLEQCRFYYVIIMKNFRIFIRFYSNNILLVYTVLVLLIIYNIYFILLLFKTIWDVKLILVFINSLFNCMVIIQFSSFGESMENIVSIRNYFFKIVNNELRSIAKRKVSSMINYRK